MSSAREPKDLELPQGSEVVAGSDLPRDGDELLKRPHAPVLIAPPNAPGIGRGSGATNPAWMSHDQPDAPPPKRRRGQTDVHTDANAREDGIHTAPDAPAPETARADTSAAAVGTALEAARAVSTSPVAPEAAHAAAHFDEVDEEDDETVDDVSQCSNLIVNYLPHTVGETELRRLFAPHGTILTSSIITCYASYLCYSAFRSKPADGSACNPFDKAVYPWQDLFMGIVIYTISMATTAYSASGMESATVVGKTSDSSGTVANDALTVTLDDGSNGNSDGTKKAADDDEDAPVGKEQWYSYHFMMVVSAFYMAMLLSDWSTQGLTEAPDKSLSISIESFWVKILSMWACLLLYGWTLLAPYLLRNYREFPGIDFD